MIQLNPGGIERWKMRPRNLTVSLQCRNYKSEAISGAPLVRFALFLTELSLPENVNLIRADNTKCLNSFIKLCAGVEGGSIELDEDLDQRR